MLDLTRQRAGSWHAPGRATGGGGSKHTVRRARDRSLIRDRSTDKVALVDSADSIARPFAPPRVTADVGSCPPRSVFAPSMKLRHAPYQ